MTGTDAITLPHHYRFAVDRPTTTGYAVKVKTLRQRNWSFNFCLGFAPDALALGAHFEPAEGPQFRGLAMCPDLG